MSDISLRDYLARLDQLSQAGSADEVLWHARHVLQFYPKNIEAYRFIGRALVALGRWDEANATLRRVLSVLPDDKTAHLLLSTAHERKNRPDEAIWHLERAFERDPNDTYLLDELKRLYKDHRGIANPRIQLTTAAVARQNIRSRDFDRAIESLRASLKRSPQRADLRLLLADALWQKGSTIDAAETALDVLQGFPDCLEANKILATLWLSEQRPSDARRHLNRIEAVDPYLALELVQGHSVDKNNFVLPELDYQRQAHAAMVGAQPDWLDNIDLQTQSESEDVTPTAKSDRFEDIFAGYTPEVIDEPGLESPSDSNESDTEWLSQLDSIEMSYKLNTSALQSTTSPLTPAEDEAFIEGDLPNFSAPTNGNEEGFAFDWAEDDTLNEETASEPLELVNEDPLAWLRSSGIEVTDNPPQSTSLLEATEDIVYDDPEMATQEDPLEWLKDYGTQVTDAWENEASQAALVDDLSMRSTEEVDAIESEIEEDFPMPDLDTIVDDWSVQSSSEDQWSGVRAPQTMPLRSPETILPEEMANPLDEWEMNERLLNESLGLEALNDVTPAATSLEVSFLDDDDFSAIIDAVPHAPPTAPLPPMSDEDWDAIDRAMNTASSSSEDMIMSDTKNPDFEHDEETPKAVEEEVGGATDMLDWLGSIAEDDIPTDEATSPTPDVATGSTGMLGWLAQGENPAYDVTPEQISTSEEPTGSTGILNWLSQNRPVPPTVPLGQANIEPEFSAQDLNIPDSPDWLQELVDTPQPAASPTSGAGATDMLEWLDDAEVPPGTAVLPRAQSGEEVLPPDTNWLNTVYEEEQLQQPPAQVTEEIMWDEDVTFEEELAAETPMGEWVATDVLPDLPLTEPFGSETAPFNQTESFATARLETAPGSGDESFAALADWLQTSDLAEEEAVSFDPLAEDQSAEEMPIEGELDIAEPAYEIESANVEEVMLDVDAPVMLENSILDDGEEEFVTSLLDTGETQTLPTWMTDVTGEATTAEAFAAEPLEAVTDDASEWLETAQPLDAVTDDASEWLETTQPLDAATDDASEWLETAQPLDAVTDDASKWLETAQPLDAVTGDASEWLETAAPIGAVGVVAAALASESSTDDDAQLPDETPMDILEPAYEDWGLDSDPVESVEVEYAEADPEFEAELSTFTTEETEEAIDEIQEPEVIEDNTYYSAFEDLPAAELEAVENGSNAPDWLNAMVPGLDIDTTAGAQGITDLLDDDMTDETADAAAMPEDYQWLNEMVEEETQSDIIVPAVASQSPRFIFSRPPRWLRRLLEGRAEDVEATDNSDLPAWLR